MVLPYCHVGELFDLVTSRKRLGESDARPVFRDILAGIYFLHSLGICDITSNASLNLKKKINGDARARLYEILRPIVVSLQSHRTVC